MQDVDDDCEEGSADATEAIDSKATDRRIDKRILASSWRGMAALDDMSILCLIPFMPEHDCVF